jgi:hypothetical protein
LRTDGATHFVRVATMLGAPFPDGTQMPTLAIAKSGSPQAEKQFILSTFAGKT